MTEIVELENGKSRVYHGNYTFYTTERESERAAQQHKYESQRKEQTHIEEKIAQLKQWAETSHRDAGKQGTPSERRQTGYKTYHQGKAKTLERRAKSQIQRLEKLHVEGVHRPQVPQSVRFAMADSSLRGRFVIEATGLGKHYGDRVLFNGSDFYVLRGDRLGLVGRNGCGKTTLLRMILGDERVTEGALWVSPSVKSAYLAQDEGLPMAATIADLERELTSHGRTRFRASLADLGFGETHFRMPIAKFSLGERTRLRLAWILQSDYNLLILDEPTNHLDIQSREALERALLSYQGTLLVATHDQYFRERVCNTWLVFGHSRIRRMDKAGSPEEFSVVAKSEGRATARKLSEAPAAKPRLMEERMVLDTQITRLLGELSTLSPEDAKYAAIDAELNRLLAQKRQLLKPR